MPKRRVPINSVNIINILEEGEHEEEKYTRKQCLCKWFKIILIFLIIILILSFIVGFVVLPLVFMDSINLQRLVIFHNRNDTPENSDFTSFEEYGIVGAKNVYVTVNENPSVSLGVWHILPEALINDAINNKNFDYEKALAVDTYPAVLYFHDTDGHRITPIETYKVLRKFFHVIAFDYRSYGDSTEGDLSEDEIIKDCTNLYEWLNMQVKEIFLWGHSLGGSLSTRTISKLKELGVKPMGLFLEAPFTTMAEQFEYSTIATVYSWLAWYDITIVDPLYENGFRFEASKHILDVDCPIMVLHAEDDDFTPFILGEKLANIAQENRNDNQGSVTFHSFPAHLGYDHWRIYKAPELPTHIEDHIDVCREYNKGVS